MLDIQLLRDRTSWVAERLATKGVTKKEIDAFLKTDARWRSLITSENELLAEQKKLGKNNRNQAVKLKTRRQRLQAELHAVQEERQRLLLRLPNLPFEDVPVGNDARANVVLRTHGERPTFAFPPKNSETLARHLDLFDKERATRIAGNRFGYWKNEAVLIEFALLQYALKVLVQEGFTPMLPPVMVRQSVLDAMGKTKLVDSHDIYAIPEDNLYLVGSSEHSIGPFHAGETFAERTLPKRYVAFSTCFRRESGSYGKDTKGMIRVHQFDKLEMVSFCHPKHSEEEHAFLVSLQERLMQGLGLHYRVIANATGDMTFADARQFDIETWFPSENAYRETHSCSNTTDFQSRGLNIRYTTKAGKTEFVHLLNGTVFSQRPILAILENFQTESGTVRIPGVLVPYCGVDVIRRDAH